MNFFSHTFDCASKLSLRSGPIKPNGTLVIHDFWKYDEHKENCTLEKPILDEY